MTAAPADLFDWANGAARRDAGMTAAAAAQDRADGGWSERAYAAIERVAEAQSTVHVDDVLAVFDEAREHPNAWGAVWARALRNGDILRGHEFRESRTARKHRHRYPVYWSGLWRQEAAE